MMHAFLDGLSPTVHISHRGGAALAPENTLAAFLLAVNHYRTDILELDLQLSRDGALVVSHDETVDRCTDGAGRIRDLSFAELNRLDAGFHFVDAQGCLSFRGTGQRIPLLRDVLRLFPDARLNIELKPHNTDGVHELSKLLRQESALRRVCIGSESDALGELLWNELPDACHFYPSEAAAAFVLSVKADEPVAKEERYSVLDIPLWFGSARVFDSKLQQAAQAHHKWVNVWTVNEPSEMEQLVQEKVGGIMTDRPDLLRQVLSRAR